MVCSASERLLLYSDRRSWNALLCWVCSLSGHGYWFSMVDMMLPMESCLVDISVLRKLGLHVLASRFSVLLGFSCLNSLNFSSPAERLRSFSSCLGFSFLASRLSHVSGSRISGVASNRSAVGRASVAGSTPLAAHHAALGASGHAAIISLSFFFSLWAIGDSGAMDPERIFMSELIDAGSSAEPGSIQL